MSRNVRFIHAADVHLGAPVRGLSNVSPEWADRLTQAIAESFDRLVATAIERHVDFVVLAGDIADNSRPSYGDFVRFYEGLERLDAAGIPVYLIAGNHDPYTTWARDIDRLPASARLLGAGKPEFTLFRKEGEPTCIIGGRSYYTQTWQDGQNVCEGISREEGVQALEPTDPDAANALFTIGVIHTGMQADKDKSPVEERELLARSVDYWACGHLHYRVVLPNDRDPRIVFPGCIQASDIKESGEHGCFLVELSENPAGRSQVQLEFVPLSSVVLQRLRVDVSACLTLADVVRLVQASLFHENSRVHCDDIVARVTLTGKTPLHEFLQSDKVISDLREHINNAHPNYYCDAIADSTRMPSESARSHAEGMFPAILEDMASEQRAREDVLVNYVQSELVKRGISVPDSLVRRIGEFNATAEMITRDLLSEESE